jgi:hypothetical protein
MATSPSRAFDRLFDPVYASSKSPVIRMSPGKGTAGFATQASPVTGASRTKYFSRPLGDVLEPYSPEVHLDTRGGAQRRISPGRRAMPQAHTAIFAAEPQSSDVKRTVGVQTVYRESEAQTDPYTPDFVIPEGATEAEAAEILSLRHMTFANGALPAGVNEVREIIEMRAQHAFDEALPTGTDEASLALRKQMLERREMAGLRKREAEIDALATQTLDELRETMHIRQEQRAMLAELRIDSVHRAHVEEREAKFTSIQSGRVKQLRKMVRARGAAEDALSRSVSVSANNGRFGRDIIGEYTDFGSSIYAPLRRMGASLANPGGGMPSTATQRRGGGGLAPLGGAAHAKAALANGAVLPIDSDALLESLRSIESNVGGKGGAAKLSASTRGGFVPSSGGGRGVRRAHAIAEQLELMQRTISAERAAAKAKSPRSATSSPRDTLAPISGGAGATAEESGAAVPMLKRPPVPDVAKTDADALSADAENRRIALVLLQSLIRGRAVQNLMYEGKQQRVALINELRLNEPDAETIQREAWVAEEEDAKDALGDLGASAADPFGTELEGLQAEAIAAVLARLAAAAAVEDKFSSAEAQRATVADEVDNVLAAVIGK